MPTYPDESWPSDAAVHALDGGMDLPTGLPYIPRGTGPASMPSYEVQYNRRLHRLNAILAGWRQGMVVDEGALRIGVYPVEYTLGGQRRTFTGASGVAVADDAALVVYLDEAATLHVESAWPVDVSSYLPLASIETQGGQMSLVDRRVRAAFHVPSFEAADARDRRVLTAHRSLIGSGETDLVVFGFEADRDMSLDGVQLYCSGMDAGASVDVKREGTSLLSSAAVPVAGEVVHAAVAASSITGGDALTVHVTTDGTGSIADLTVSLLVGASPLLNG